MKISVITAVWNGARTIRDTMESVARQRLSCGDNAPEGVELEYIIVDGGSTDGTVELIRAFMDQQEKGQSHARNLSVRWISERDKGLYDGINKGIRMATGDVVGICNADDILAEDDTILHIATAFAEDRSLEAIYADIRFVKDVANREAMRAAKTVRYCTGRFFRRWQFRFATFPAHPSTFIRKSCFEAYGLYSLDYPICADFELMLRFFWKNRIRARYLPICTHVMRMGGVSTKNLKSNLEINKEDLRALRTNGVWSCLPLIYLKYFAKIWGFVLKR